MEILAVKNTGTFLFISRVDVEEWVAEKWRR